jgi:adenylyl-sulfate kinase
MDAYNGTADIMLGSRPTVIWLTGLSGAGKSTVGKALVARLRRSAHNSVLLDGDHLRSGLCSDLTFSLSHRREQVRRAAEVAWILATQGVVPVVALIAPLVNDRALAASRFRCGIFAEVFVSTPLEVCEMRDVKGLYAMARRGEVRDFTGVSSPYEPPLSPLVEVRTDRLSVDECVETILNTIMAVSGSIVDEAT